MTELTGYYRLWCVVTNCQRAQQASFCIKCFTALNKRLLNEKAHRIFVFCFSFIYFHDQLEFSRNAASINKTALVETKFNWRRLALRLPSCVQLCLSVCLLLYVHNALQFIWKCTCLDILLFLFFRFLVRASLYNSNKSPTRCNSFPVYYPDVYLQLNMFRAFSRPSSGAQWLQWQPLLLPSYRGDSRAVFVVAEHSTTVTTIRR
jgi:hypothetical protein